MSVKALVNLGLEKEEALLYLALLELKEASLSEVAKHLGKNRTTFYPYVESLLKRGFIKKRTSGKKIIYSPSSPDVLKEELSRKSRILEDVLPKLHELYQQNDEEALVLQYTGKDEIKQIIKEIFQESKFVQLLFSVDSLFAFLNNSGDEEEFFTLLDSTNSKELVENNASGHRYAKYSFFANSNERPIKLLPEHFKLDTELIVWDSGVCFISFANSNALVIKDAKLAKLHKKLFLTLWDLGISV